MRHPEILPLDAAFSREAEMLAAVKAGEPATPFLWQAEARCLVAPRAMAAKTDSGAAASAARGWPLFYRGTGGDVTPQGPGVVNLSLAFVVARDMPHPIAAAYEAICAPFLTAFSGLGMQAGTGAVAGSYCDGDFNVTVDGLKFAGTAQRMSPMPGNKWAVLGHAMFIADGSEAEIVDAINALYADAGMERRVANGVNVTLAGLGISLEDFLSALTAAAR